MDKGSTAVQPGTVQHRAVQCPSVARDSAAWGSVAPDSPAWGSAVQSSTARDSASRNTAARGNAAWSSAASQCSSVECSTGWTHCRRVCVVTTAHAHHADYRSGCTRHQKITSGTCILALLTTSIVVLSSYLIFLCFSFHVCEKDGSSTRLHCRCNS